jgi:hypothetical protein
MVDFGQRGWRQKFITMVRIRNDFALIPPSRIVLILDRSHLGLFSSWIWTYRQFFSTFSNVFPKEHSFGFQTEDSTFHTKPTKPGRMHFAPEIVSCGFHKKNWRNQAFWELLIDF